jgi:hypothetical protein
MWCVATLDQEYIARMEDVLKIYENPLSESQPVVCVDEKPVVLHEDTRPSILMRPGQVARRDYEYKRCGTANIFCGIEPKAGVHSTKVTPTRSSPEFADFLLEIAEHYPAADTIHLVMDNLSTHSRKALVDRFGEEAGGCLPVTEHRTFATFPCDQLLRKSLITSKLRGCWRRPYRQHSTLYRSPPLLIAPYAIQLASIHIICP